MKLLFVCSGNTCRSPVAAGLAKDFGVKKNMLIEVRTAGLFPHEGRHVDPRAVEVMREVGIDISSECSKPLITSDLEWANFIVPLQEAHAAFIAETYPLFEPKLRSLGADIDDPFCEGVAVYRRRRDEIGCLLASLLPALLHS